MSRARTNPLTFGRSSASLFSPPPANRTLSHRPPSDKEVPIPLVPIFVMQGAPAGFPGGAIRGVDRRWAVAKSGPAAAVPGVVATEEEA